MSEQSAEKARPPRGPEHFLLWGLVILGIVSTVGLTAVRTVYRPFTIPSASMEPTLQVGDYMLAARITADKARRGDVLIFKDPKGNGYDVVKRLIGLPGDRVQMMHGFLYLNGVVVNQEPMVRPKDQDPYSDVTDSRERLPDGRAYVIRSQVYDGPGDDTATFVVPPGQYFFLGDNRDSAADSRFKREVGGLEFVPAANIIRKADIVVLSTRGAKGRLFRKVE